MFDHCERIKSLTEKQLEDPNEGAYTILAHTVEELGELSTALCVEDNSSVKGYKELDESSVDESIDVLICALSMYYARGGKTISLTRRLDRKLNKWESKING